MNENNNEQEQPLYKEAALVGADFCGIVRYVLADDDLCCRAEQPVHWQNRY